MYWKGFHRPDELDTSRYFEDDEIVTPTPKHSEEETYTVWVGGSEVNDHLLTKDQAERLAKCYIADGYDDVQIEELKAE